MLNIYFGDMPDAIYNTSIYFKNTYQPKWITKPLSIEMIRDVDKSEVVDTGLIESPVLGKIPPTSLSGGVKTLMLVDNDTTHVFNASNCGDNCAKWLLRIADEHAEKKKKVTVNLHHIMDFGRGPFKIKVVNDNRTVTNMAELLEAACRYL